MQTWLGEIFGSILGLIGLIYAIIFSIQSDYSWWKILLAIPLGFFGGAFSGMLLGLITSLISERFIGSNEQK